MDAHTQLNSEKWRTVGIVLCIALCGPAVGVLLFAFGLVLAPPWTFLSSLIYVPVACLALPVGVVALALGWIGGRGLLLSLSLAVVAGLFYLAAIGPGLPTGMTDCRPNTNPNSPARFVCVSTSSDDLTYREEFTLEGPPGSPLMRMRNEK